MHNDEISRDRALCTEFDAEAARCVCYGEWWAKWLWPPRAEYASSSGKR